MFYTIVTGALACLVLLLVILALTKHPVRGCNGITEKIFAILDKYHLVFFFLLLLLFAFTRLYYLGIIPAGIHVDEIGMAYDADCLAKYGMDRHLTRYPVYLQNYGSGQSALYAYLTMLLLKVFPYSVRLIRIPAVVCGFFCFLSSFFLIDDITEHKSMALLGPLFVTVTPYFMTSERWALDCNLFLSLATVSLCLTVRACRKAKSWIYVLAGLGWGITLYTYAISYLVIPLFLVLLILYLLRVKKEWKCLYMLIPVVLLGIPLLIFQMVNMRLIGSFSLGFTDFVPIDNFRGGEIRPGNVLRNLPNIITNLYGGDGLTYNAFPEFGPVYLCMIPLILYGAVMAVKDTVRSVKNKELQAISVVVLFFASSWLVMLLVSANNFNKANHFYISYIVFAVYGLICLEKTSRQTVILQVLCVALSFLLFANFYFREQNEKYGFHYLFMNTKPGDVIAYAEQHYDPADEKKLYVCLNYDDLAGYIPMFVCLYGNVHPKYGTQKQTDFGKIYLNLPEEFDEREDAVYIIGNDWGGVISYMISVGFSTDSYFDGTTILYR
ncbi:MAG: glycosyltransferase family 39 protein [Lachnospiraceae bacterium]|nr:glycosyltransferase family 39 protein [Lachnospiraceae bacterium]